MKWKDIIYQYDGSFDGLLCCIFESYTQREYPTAIYCGEEDEWSLFETRLVLTDAAHAQRVGRSLRKLSPDVLPLLRRCFLTCLPDKELAIYRFVAKLYREGPSYLTRLSDDAYQPLLRAVRAMSAEVEHLRGFVRFSDYGGLLGAEIAPKNRVLPLLRGHFCARCHAETFFLYDRTHREALLYANGRSRIVPLEDFRPAPPDAEETAYRQLWRRFYDTIAIRERENPGLRMSRMPKRYWAQMTELQHDGDALPPKP
ncbi:MAG: TIGR03915 family putative DNA repair protein [Oscillospiraceae bacterium]|nr:TIGR03915 family putative DNA repair protein [Oscillospiraceae bacterium]